jgi:hypothetical protein
MYRPFLEGTQRNKQQQKNADTEKTQFIYINMTVTTHTFTFVVQQLLCVDTAS